MTEETEKCYVCGCTEDNACVDPLDPACSCEIEDGICSACKWKAAHSKWDKEEIAA